MSGLFSPEVLVALGVSASAGLATVLGSLFVLRMDRTNSHHLAIALAFAGGAMVYVSLVEIFPKSAAALAEVRGAKAGYAWTTLAFFCGIGLLVLLDRLVPNPHPDVAATSGRDKAAVARMSLLTTAAITAHNLPEGLATFFATLDNPAVGESLAIAIALHNVPEGVSVAVPVYFATGSRWKAVLASLVSGLAEPLGAILGYIVLAPFMSPATLGVVFGILSGTMVFLALEELLPAAKRYAQGRETAYGMVAGMAVVALSLVLLR
jgi:zinc transporter, ZIP family